ncbi:hypothetical protein PGT21_027737 [Puccinia graminis f. sp. tritici]|uniref:Uncharacterized protein n=1 Tax=Puccinia graminis f. sp. tritici TaxID=56615 RepID=A0A5B0NMF0_PUCGR|nr:hypothetical protein PGT21_027737 [Puccinia graminis f. sp. tritici]
MINMRRLHGTDSPFAFLFIISVTVGFTLGVSINNIPTNPACSSSGCGANGGGSSGRGCLSLYECRHRIGGNI